jgi:hypothetical protein
MQKAGLVPNGLIPVEHSPHTVPWSRFWLPFSSCVCPVRALEFERATARPNGNVRQEGGWFESRLATLTSSERTTGTPHQCGCSALSKMPAKDCKTSGLAGKPFLSNWRQDESLAHCCNLLSTRLKVFSQARSFHVPAGSWGILRWSQRWPLETTRHCSPDQPGRARAAEREPGPGMNHRATSASRMLKGRGRRSSRPRERLRPVVPAG